MAPRGLDAIFDLFAPSVSELVTSHTALALIPIKQLEAITPAINLARATRRDLSGSGRDGQTRRQTRQQSLIV